MFTLKKFDEIIEEQKSGNIYKVRSFLRVFYRTISGNTTYKIDPKELHLNNFFKELGTNFVLNLTPENATRVIDSLFCILSNSENLPKDYRLKFFTQGYPYWVGQLRGYDVLSPFIEDVLKYIDRNYPDYVPHKSYIVNAVKDINNVDDHELEMWSIDVE